MTKAAVIAANYTHAEFKPGLKVCRIVLEIPQERRKEFFDAFGYPDPANPVPVAIARMAASMRGAQASSKENGPDSREPESLTTSTTAERGVSAPHSVEAEGQDKPRILTKSQKAALRLRDKDFQAWLVDTYWTGKEEIGDYDGLLKRALGITSKTQLDTPGPKADAWDKLLTSFEMRSYAR